VSETLHLATIESSVRECDAHLRWIERNRELLADAFPLAASDLEGADERTIELVDQLIYRFTKLQDSMARRLLPSFYALLEGRDDSVPFLDMLHRLEQLGLLTSAADWQLFRALRNNLSHDYPETIKQTTLTLNQLYAEWPKLREMFARFRDEYQKRSRA
jgi:hypothetical protein